MASERDYASLMPAEPPEGLMCFLQKKEGRFQRGVLAFGLIGRDAAEAEKDCEDFAGDFRPEWGKERGHRTALLWCSECCREMLAEYIKDEGCWHHYGGPPAGIRLNDDFMYGGGRHEFAENNHMNCPHCGADVWLLRQGDLTYGRCEQVFVSAMTVADGLPVITQWCVERRIYWRCQEQTFIPVFGYVVDGKRIVRMAQYQKYMNGVLSHLGGWVQRKNASDTLGTPLFYDKIPCLDGTSLENAKLSEYYAQAYEARNFCPIGYIQLYRKHPNVENLVTAGMGKLLGGAIRKEIRDTSNSWGERYITPKLKWIHWKENRPAQMLGLTKEQLRQARAYGWSAEALEFWNKVSDRMRFADAAEILRLVGVSYAAQMLADEVELLKTARYLHKQGENYTTLRDYRSMVRKAGLNLEEEITFWPPHLRQAHDRTAMEVKYKIDNQKRESFARMSARCAGLRWERDGICIRPALTPEELIEEGRVLNHCVGGYAGGHAAGQIILFVRHTRRPERSWFTLNVDVKTKRVIQLHGYGNEYSPKGERIQIPRKVKDFVEQWKAQVLEPWKLPPEKKTRKPAKKRQQKQKCPTA